jgi:hypothetical protein
MIEWVILAGGLLAAAAILAWWFRSADAEIKGGVERARRRHFHKTAGGWTKLPWERDTKTPDRKDN